MLSQAPPPVLPLKQKGEDKYKNRMNSKQLKLKIVTPERLILEEMVDQVTLPTTLGEITVLPEHIPLIAGLASGDVVAV